MKLFLNLFVFLTISCFALSQNLPMVSMIDSTIWGRQFEGYSEIKNNQFLTINANTNLSIFAFSLLDSNANLLLSKSYKIFDALLAQNCGVSSTSGGKFYAKDIRLNDIDSTYEIIGTFWANYGSCPQIHKSYLLKINLNLDVVFFKEYNEAMPRSAKFINDTIAVFGDGYIIFEINTITGNVIWVKNINTTYGYIHGIAKSFCDSTFIIYGGFHGLIGEMSINGNILNLWVNTDSISTNNDKEILQVIKTIDSTYILLNMINDNTLHAYFSLTEIDRNGNVIWDKTYSNPGKRLLVSGLTSYTTSSDSGYFLPLRIRDTIIFSPNTLAALLKVDKQGNIIWDKSFNGSNTYCANIASLGEISKLPSGSFMAKGGSILFLDSLANACFLYPNNILSEQNSFSHMDSVNVGSIPWTLTQSGNDSFILQNESINVYHENCNTTSVNNLDIKTRSLNIYPNPAYDFITVTSDQICDVFIYNTSGQMLQSLKANSEVTRINISKLSPGVYFLRAGSEVSKFIKL